MHNKLTLTLNIDLEAYEHLQACLDQSTSDYSSVGEWLETEINHNAKVLAEMLLEDF